MKLGEKALTLDRTLEHAAEEANRNASNQSKAADAGFDMKTTLLIIPKERVGDHRRAFH